MQDILPNLIYKDLAQKTPDLSDYDFFRLINFIENIKSDFALDILLISFTSCYNSYLENINSITTKSLENNKEILKLLSLRCKDLAKLINIFDIEYLINYKKQLMNITLSLFSNNDIIFSTNFCSALSNIEPFFCLKALRKHKTVLTEELNNLLLNLEEEFEQYQQLSFEVEEIIHKTISDFKYDFPAFNYLDFI